MIYLLETMLFPNISCFVPNLIIDYINDLPSLGRYAWAEATNRWLMENVPQMATRVQERCSGKKTIASYLRGCTVVLNIWFNEIISIGRKVCVGRTPWILCYEKNNFWKQATLRPLTIISRCQRGINFVSSTLNPEILL